jgi:hypothetical protein
MAQHVDLKGIPLIQAMITIVNLDRKEYLQ